MYRRKALEDFDAAHAELLSVGIDEPLAIHAGGWPRNRATRYDAGHLASALALGDSHRRVDGVQPGLQVRFGLHRVDVVAEHVGAHADHAAEVIAAEEAP